MTFEKDVSAIHSFILNNTHVYIDGIVQDTYNYTITEMN